MLEGGSAPNHFSIFLRSAAALTMVRVWRPTIDASSLGVFSLEVGVEGRIKKLVLVGLCPLPSMLPNAFAGMHVTNGVESVPKSAFNFDSCQPE